MSAETAVLQGRAAAEALMVDTCTISRVTGGSGILDPETGTKTPAATATVYQGRCRVQTYEAHESTPDSGGHVYTVQRYAVHIPVGAAIKVEDLITVTASVLDPNLAGRDYKVVGLLHKSHATAQRLAVDEIVR